MAYAAITALLDGTDHRTPQAKATATLYVHRKAHWQDAQAVARVAQLIEAGIPLTEEALDAAIEQCGRD